MRNFTRELRAVLAGPPRITQTNFARHSGIERTKLSRILSDFTQVNRDDLDAMLQALPVEAEDAKGRLVLAFLKDCISYGAMMHVRVKGSDKLALAEEGFSPEVRDGLRDLSQSSRRADAEPILLAVCNAFKG